MVYGNGCMTHSSGTKEVSELVGRKLRTTVGDNVLGVALTAEDRVYKECNGAGNYMCCEIYF